MPPKCILTSFLFKSPNFYYSITLRLIRTHKGNMLHMTNFNINAIGLRQFCFAAVHVQSGYLYAKEITTKI